MLRNITRKEIIEIILDLRFTTVTLLCVVLIPLGMYISMKDYEQRFEDYRRAKQLYQKRYGKHIHSGLKAQGFRPPSVLSVLSFGADPFIPDKVITSKDGLFQTAKETGISNPQSLLFGRSDLLFNASFILSLAALIFTFNCISGEKEKGTLRMMISNSIPRSRILLAKIVGNYLTLLIPLVISLLIGLIILDASPDISIFSSSFWPAFLVIVLITFLFVLAAVTLGICISTLTHSSLTSIVMLLLVWVIFVLGIPKASPMIAQIAYPVESQGVVNLRKQILMEDINSELWQRRRELFSRCMTTYGATLKTVPSTTPNTNAEKQAYAQYESEVLVLEREYQKRTANELRKIDQDYRNKRNTQASIAINLSRISPVSCYTYFVSNLSGTGVTAQDNFIKNAQRFQDEVQKTVYDNFREMIYGGIGGHTSGKSYYVEGFNPDTVSFPEMHYQYSTLVEVLQTGWIDILLLFLFNILFFSLAFIRFRKYDVR